MKQIQRFLAVTLIISFSLILTFPAVAQEVKGGQLDDFDNGTLAFSYPDGWEVNEYENVQLAIVYSEGSTADLSDLAFDRDPNSYLIRLIAGDRYNDLGDVSGIVGYEFRAWLDYWVQDYDVLERSSVDAPIETGLLNDQPYAILTTYLESHDGVETQGVFIALEVQRGDYIVMAGFADDGDLETLQAVMLQMAETVEISG